MIATPGPHPPVVGRGRLARGALFLGGWLLVAIGAVGVVVPVLPSTIFFIGATWCFARCSPRFEGWILGLPKIGPMVRDHRDGLGMPMRTKYVAIGTMSAAISVSGLVLRPGLWLLAGLLTLWAIGAAWIRWRVPTREVVLARRERDAA